MISFNPLWKTLIDKGIKRSRLTEIGISSTIIAKMGKNQNVNTATIDKICEYLDCRIEDVIEYIHQTDERMLSKQ